MSQPEKKPQPPIQWTFPPATGPVPWTLVQLRAHKHQHGLQYLGCELNPEYGPLQQDRITAATPAPDLFSIP